MITDLFTPGHIILVLVGALLIFGPKRLPDIGKSLGKGIREFRGALNSMTGDEPEVPPAPAATVPAPPAPAQAVPAPAATVPDPPAPAQVVPAPAPAPVPTDAPPAPPAAPPTPQA